MIVESFLLLFSGLSLISSLALITEMDHYKQCELIEGSACKGLGYSYTLFPNIFKHATQLEAMRELQNYYPLISIQCSLHLLEFLCTLYIPPCTDKGFHLPPCKSLCLQVQEECSPVQKLPEKFDCDNFPSSHELLCLSSDTNVTYYDPPKEPPMGGDEAAPPPRKMENAVPTSTALPLQNDQNIQCLNDSECHLEGSVCRGGECICQYPKSWGPLGCQYTQILGGFCESTAECAAVTPNTICSEAVCKCKKPLTNYRNLACIHGSKVGALCYNDAQCRAVNTYSFCKYLVAQVVGTCVCDPDQFVNSDRKCKPRLGGRCEKECPRELGKASCRRSRKSESRRCQCQKSAFQAKGVCVGLASSYGDYDY